MPELTRPVLPFAALSFLASFLLFFVQPLVGKIVLPQLGGSPAIWMSAMVAFQALLLAGYAYAHALQRMPAPWQSLLHVTMLTSALLWLPVSIAVAEPPQEAILTIWVPWRVMLAVGPLFVLLAAQAPLLQSWYRDCSNGAEPYRLYVWSNLGSLTGLLAYPLGVEPISTLTTQRLLWSGGFLIFVVGTGSLMIFQRKQPRWRVEADRNVLDWPDWRVALRWITLSAIPSGMVLSTTAHITTDIVALPLLWALPLALYLLSFVMAFADLPRLMDAVTRVAAPSIALLGIVALSTETFDTPLTGSASLVLLFVASLALHRRLYQERPGLETLTAFYLLLAAGGALGGLAVAVIAPLIFDWSYEFPILILAAIIMAGNKSDRPNSLITVLTITSAITLTLAKAFDWIDPNPLAIVTIFTFALLLNRKHRAAIATLALCSFLCTSGIDAISLSAAGLRQRSYFGVYTIRENVAGTLRTLAHGTTTHGVQLLTSGIQAEPTSYFGPQSGVGRVLNLVPRIYGDQARISVVGLGVGTLACYARPGQKWMFHEIDPLVVDIAIRQRWFTFMVNCAPDAHVLLGDARLTLAKESALSLDVLVLDAFTSDSIPTHLLTREAFDIYAKILKPEGALLFHISNRYLDLEPIIASEVEARGWHASIVKHQPDKTEEDRGEKASSWIIVSQTGRQLQKLTAVSSSTNCRTAAQQEPLMAKPGFPRWEDEFSPIAPLIKWQQISRALSAGPFMEQTDECR